MRTRIISLSAILLALTISPARAEDNRWRIDPEGSITWLVKKGETHTDHIETSGQRVSTVLRYGVRSDGSFQINYGMVWPLLRTVPNDTHASLMRRIQFDAPSFIQVSGRNLGQEQVERITLDGVMTVQSRFPFSSKDTLSLTRTLYSSTENPAFLTRYILRNRSRKSCSIEIPEFLTEHRTDPEKGVDGSYSIRTRIHGSGAFMLAPGDSVIFHASIAAYRQGEPDIDFDFEQELKKRQDFRREVWGNLVLDTPDRTLNTMFAFAKIRGLESIYKTKGGYLHGPGGESYYAAIWANDQAEYINPLFPFTGYAIGNESALTSYLHFARFMNDHFEPIPSSIIAEGTDIWNGAGDRGDAAMIAYGASRYALALGDRQVALKLWPLIQWCLEYCDHKLTADGVVASDTDELENRFPSGNANLCTSSLYYDALRSAAFLAGEINQGHLSGGYLQRADRLRSCIEAFFGSQVEGFRTYRYYQENKVLRAWICIPLTVGIYDRKDGTLDALFSEKLWTGDGLLSQSGEKTYWDRSTLYALRGALQSGDTERAMEHLEYYSSNRLLGEHVPYAIEAWPEGDQRHLSAESGLYARIITEGLFGIRPTGFRSFELSPRLPKAWPQMSLSHIRAFGGDFSIQVRRTGKDLSVEISSDGKPMIRKTIKEGSTMRVRLKE